MSGAHQSARREQVRGGPARVLRDLDRLQQRHRVLAVAVATWKKFSDDQAGNLAALIAYYAFASIFPLLLVLVTVLDLVLRSNEALRDKLLSSALHQYPVIGPQLGNTLHPLKSTGIALAVGLLFLLYGARGIAVAMQNAVNTLWGVPLYRRPHFPWSLLRSLGLIGVIGPGMMITITLSSVAGGTGHLSGIAARLIPTAVSLVLNVGLFWAGFRLAASDEVASRHLWLSAVLSAIFWQLLQLVGGYLVGHQLATKSVYGVFGLVLGLLAWFYLQAQVTLYLVELNVVRVRRLWPRSLTPPPLTAADLRAYELYAEASQRSPALEIEVHERPASSADQAETEGDAGPGPLPGPG